MGSTEQLPFLTDGFAKGSRLTKGNYPPQKRSLVTPAVVGILVLTAIVAGVLKYANKSSVADAEVKEAIQERKHREEASLSDSLNVDFEEEGIDKEAFVSELEAASQNLGVNVVSSQSTSGCVVDPLENGSCANGYTLEDGCCLPISQPDRTAGEMAGDAAKLAGNVALSVGAGIALQQAGTRLTRTILDKTTDKLIGRAAAKQIKSEVADAAEKAGKEAVEKGLKKNGKAYKKAVNRAMRKAHKKAAAKVLAKAGSKGGAKAAQALTKKVGQKIAAKAALAAARAGVKVASMASKAGTGVGIVLAVFDAVNMILDAADPEGYNNFAENKLIQDYISTVEFVQEKEAKAVKAEYPFIFPLKEFYADEYHRIVDSMLIEKFGDAMNDIPDSMHDEMDALDAADDPDAAWDAAIRDSYAKEGVTPPAGTQYPKHIDEAMDKAYMDAVNADPIARDELIFKALRTSTVIDQSHLAFYPSMSTRERIGVGLTEAGVTAWNQLHKKTWFKYYDIFNDAKETPPADFHEPVVGIFVDAYRSLNKRNPGTQSAPNMMASEVPKMAWANEWKVYGKEVPSGGIEFTNALLEQRLRSGTRKFSDAELEGMQIKDITTMHFVKVKDLYYRPAQQRLGMNWRRVPVDKGTSRPLRGAPIPNNPLLASQLKKGYTSFTRKVADSFRLPRTLTEDDYILVDGKAYVPTHSVSLYLRAGFVFSYCENFRNQKFAGGMFGKDKDDANPGIDPKVYGVRFHDGTYHDSMVATREKPNVPIPNPIQCVYTDTFCTRMGMTHQYDFYNNSSDCHAGASTSGFEAISGATVSKGAYRGWHNALGYICDPKCGETEYCEGRTCNAKFRTGEKVGGGNGWKCLSGKEIFGTCHNGIRSLDFQPMNSNPEPPEVGFNHYTGGAKYCKSMAEDWGKCSECTGAFGVGNGFCDASHEGRMWKDLGTARPSQGHELINWDLADALSRKQDGGSCKGYTVHAQVCFSFEEVEKMDLFRNLPSGRDILLNVPGKENQLTLLRSTDFVKSTNGRYYSPVFGTKYCENGKCHNKLAAGDKVGPTARWKCNSGQEIFGTCHNGVGSLDVGTEVGFDAFTGGAKYCKSGVEHFGKCVECKESKHCAAARKNENDDAKTEMYCKDYQCNFKRDNGEEDDGNSSHCISGHNHQGKCVECWKNEHCDGKKAHDNTPLPVCGNDYKCVSKIPNGQPVVGGHWNCKSGHDHKFHDGTKCVECWKNEHCDGKKAHDNTPLPVCGNNFKCVPLLEYGEDDLGSHANCEKGHSHEGKCVDCWKNEHCDKGLPVCGNDYKCVSKIPNGQPVVGGYWNCESGHDHKFDDGTKCVECWKNEHCDGKKAHDNTPLPVCGKDFKCVSKIPNGQPVVGGYWNCESGHDHKFHDGTKCVECWKNEHCDGKKAHDNTPLPVCGNDYKCVSKIPNGQPVVGGYWNCESGHHHGDRCVQCWSDDHCDGDTNVCNNYWCTSAEWTECTKEADGNAACKSRFGNLATYKNQYEDCGKKRRDLWWHYKYLCIPPPRQNWECYRDRYPDLKAAFGNDAGRLINHYNTHGRREGRQFNC